MTRPALRMCTRCQCITDEPVLVHEVHAATGPGFNVYACPPCAAHYPPQPDTLELLESAQRRSRSRSRLTIRVYRIDTAGTVTADSGRVEILTSRRAGPVPRASAYPPCACPRCSMPR
ncbi:hypothetical protein OHB10_20155 [Streptomyces sp. NBC_01597]|uniref:hypothetical protein n=1 Tax=unclassified Streptomyces TaxID=2593676 RepID=UPI00225B5476|nr:hypothetical protein [Streptomyces sp. NBC_00452]MCX5060639.1 hypothetical protein [Streptomyces sp. NBC_00452]